MINNKDFNTPDDWISRHPDMIRLTGNHPFNAEPPLTTLINSGKILDKSLHYVRNHGCVPRINWEEHELIIDAIYPNLINNPIILKMDDIVNMDSITFLCNLTCAGNRRKELNMIKKTIGFNWGSAATACSEWTGIPLRSLLLKAKINLTDAKYVCFEGADKLPNGFYGTSIDINYAMDIANDIIIAFKQNGEYLTPDHGYPCRIIIPGMIGGRMVKWLTKIIISDKESENYYHYFDNRILPSYIDKELADNDKWWYKQEYIFNELNINSVIALPAHDEIINTNNDIYIVKGYAYSGGGKKITRVEISFDNGLTWNLCTLNNSKPNDYGKYWCWCLWDYNVDMNILLKTINSYICVRAWDQTNNTQPSEYIWNLMGMGNNCYMKIQLILENIDNNLKLICKHPIIPGPKEGGWITKSVDNIDKLKKIEKLDINIEKKLITIDEVNKHSNKESPWIIINDKVYDCTNFLNKHPGGEASILMYAGKDCSDEFTAIHSTNAFKMLEKYYIGNLIKNVINIKSETGLNKKKNITVKLVNKTKLTRDTRLFRFSLPTDDNILGLPIGNHLFICANIDNKYYQRAYTPISQDDDVGFVEFIIKIYFKNENPRFPQGGLMTQYLEMLNIDDTIDIKGPIGHFKYLGKQEFEINNEKRSCKYMGLIAGGSGITPIYQIIKYAIKNKDYSVKFFILYANQTPNDIILYNELLELSKNYKDIINIWFTIDKNPDEIDWNYSTGFIDELMLKTHMPPYINKDNTKDITIVMCGPPPMIKFACIPNLLKIGYIEDNLISL